MIIKFLKIKIIYGIYRVLFVNYVDKEIKGIVVWIKENYRL